LVPKLDQNCQPTSRGLSKIGRTQCFNPGSEYATGVLRGLVLNLSDKKLDNYVFTEG
jgi:hypothetical protein